MGKQEKTIGDYYIQHNNLKFTYIIWDFNKAKPVEKDYSNLKS